MGLKRLRHKIATEKQQNGKLYDLEGWEVEVGGKLKKECIYIYILL